VAAHTHIKKKQNLWYRNLNGLSHTVQWHKVIENLNIHTSGWANESNFAESAS
jgi:hypothetical protein